MRTLTYTGRAGRRRFGKEDGMTTDVEFERGVPTEVADANAEAILDGPHGDEFTESETTTGTANVPPDNGSPEPGDEQEA